MTQTTKNEQAQRMSRRTFLSSLAMTMADLYTQGGFSTERPPTLEALTAQGFFEQEATRKLLSQMTKPWYTGTYTTAEGKEAVATFVDALAWHTLVFTKPMTICGYPGFLSEAWEQVLD